MNCHFQISQDNKKDAPKLLSSLVAELSLLFLPKGRKTSVLKDLLKKFKDRSCKGMTRLVDRAKRKIYSAPTISAFWEAFFSILALSDSVACSRIFFCLRPHYPPLCRIKSAHSVIYAEPRPLAILVKPKTLLSDLAPLSAVRILVPKKIRAQ